MSVESSVSTHPPGHDRQFMSGLMYLYSTSWARIQDTAMNSAQHVDVAAKELQQADEGAAGAEDVGQHARRCQTLPRRLGSDVRRAELRARCERSADEARGGGHAEGHSEPDHPSMRKPMRPTWA